MKKSKKARKRELISPRGDKRYVRRARGGQFEEVDDVSRSLSQDRKRTANTASKSGQGDKGDRKAKQKSRTEDEPIMAQNPPRRGVQKPVQSITKKLKKNQ